jgi:hypothetical protein
MKYKLRRCYFNYYLEDIKKFFKNIPINEKKSLKSNRNLTKRFKSSQKRLNFFF